MENKTLNYYITKYFSDYLPVIKGVSVNTIISYRDTFIDLLQYYEKNKKLSLNVVTTEIYARTNPKVKEKILKEHSELLNIKDKYSQKQKEDLLKFLKEMK